MWSGFFGEALVHVFGEVHGAEDVAAVDRHDDGGVVEVNLMVRGSCLY